MLRSSGMLHLSGEEELSYTQFAQRLSQHLDFRDVQIESVCSDEVGVKTPFRPFYPGLSMRHTQDKLGLLPESTEHLLNELKLELKYESGK
ncbi:MAG: hypothetical protein JWL63_527 [Rhodocyclales bacterium]|nr:hypothetical protein [Rhodocyclales bacterium]